MSVAVFAFQRGRYNAAFEAPWPQVALGRTADARYLQRIRALIGALPVIWRERRLLRRASIFYARNIDQLFLAFASALLAGHKPVTVYEVRSEEHTSELQSLMRISYAVFCLKKKKHKHETHN